MSSDAKHRSDTDRAVDMDNIKIDIPKAGAKELNSDQARNSPAKKGAEKSSSNKSSSSADHWSSTADGSLLARATNLIYKKIISPAKDGGLKEFFETNCLKFINLNEGEYTLEHIEIYKTYEREIEAILNNFAVEEGLSYGELIDRFSNATESSAGAGKNFNMLLYASDYKKFAVLMKKKAEEASSKTDDAAVVVAVSDFHPSDK